MNKLVSFALLGLGAFALYNVSQNKDPFAFGSSSMDASGSADALPQDAPTNATYNINIPSSDNVFGVAAAPQNTVTGKKAASAANVSIAKAEVQKGMASGAITGGYTTTGGTYVNTKDNVVTGGFDATRGASLTKKGAQTATLREALNKK